MKEITKTIYICDYCGQEHEDKSWMELHEDTCALNPKNQPCSTCANMLIGVGCTKGICMENVGGKVHCFYYKKGTPICIPGYIV